MAAMIILFVLIFIPTFVLTYMLISFHRSRREFRRDLSPLAKEFTQGEGS